MRAQLRTYYLRKWVNAIVDSTESTPSLGEMVKRHLEVDWARISFAPFEAIYAIHDKNERLLELRVTDAHHYRDQVFRQGEALLRVGVNGIMATPEDEAFARNVFGSETFRTCKVCGQAFGGWFDYFGHIKVEHLADRLDVG